MSHLLFVYVGAQEEMEGPSLEGTKRRYYMHILTYYIGGVWPCVPTYVHKATL